MFDLLREFLEILAKYGIDRVLMVVFFWLYYRSNKRIEKIQDLRLADSKEALAALISAKYILDELEKHLEDVETKVEAIYDKMEKKHD